MGGESLRAMKEDTLSRETQSHVVHIMIMITQWLQVKKITALNCQKSSCCF